jgi:hypothetical protein
MQAMPKSGLSKLLTKLWRDVRRVRGGGLQVHDFIKEAGRGMAVALSMGSNHLSRTNVKKTNKIWTIASALALTVAASSAQAAFVFTDTATPRNSAPIDVPSINNFEAQLAANGVSDFYLGRSLRVTGAQLGDVIEIDFFAADAGYRNQLWWGSTLAVDNQGNQGWSERDRGSYAASNGVLNFSFCSVNVTACLSNTANDGSRPGSSQSIGMWLTDNGNTAWLLWDDSGANSDDNHDDLIVRLTYRSVPEPGTLALLGLGLIGIALFRRRKFVA